MTSAEEGRRWYAVWVKPRCELKVEKGLEIRGLASFLPRYRVHKAWSDRVKEAESLLFPGYVFCHIRPDERLAVLTTPGVVRLVSFGGAPVIVHDSEISAIRRVVQSSLIPQPH